MYNVIHFNGFLLIISRIFRGDACNLILLRIQVFCACNIIIKYIILPFNKRHFRFRLFIYFDSIVCHFLNKETTIQINEHFNLFIVYDELSDFMQQTEEEKGEEEEEEAKKQHTHYSYEPSANRTIQKNNSVFFFHE